MSGSLKPNDLIGGRYEIQRYLDEGGMQFVYVARDQLTGREVALKTPKNPSAQKRFRRSAILAAKVNHPNVAKTFDYVREGDKRFLIEELVNGKDLKAALLADTNYLDPYLAAKVFHHFAKGVAAAHHAGVVHRDLKPTNIMIVGEYSFTELKITDFGVARMAGDELKEAVHGGEASMTASQTVVGALPYMAPEVIETPAEVNKPADIWSVGAIMWHLICGTYPFGQGLSAVTQIIAAKPPNMPAFVTANPQFKPLAQELIAIALSCLKKNPLERPTADQLVQKCSNLCYTSAIRERGKVQSFKYDAYGFIDTPNGNAFFHKDCVYGDLPKIGDKVLFSSYISGDVPRALPVQKLNK